MLIKLTPQRRDETLVVTKVGDLLSLNGVAFDFGPLPDGATLPADAINSPWIMGDVSRINGEIEITLILPHGADASEAARFPEPIQAIGDGIVELPV